MARIKIGHQIMCIFGHDCKWKGRVKVKREGSRFACKLCITSSVITPLSGHASPGFFSGLQELLEQHREAPHTAFEEQWHFP